MDIYTIADSFIVAILSLLCLLAFAWEEKAKHKYFATVSYYGAIVLCCFFLDVYQERLMLCFPLHYLTIVTVLIAFVLYYFRHSEIMARTSWKKIGKIVLYGSSVLFIFVLISSIKMKNSVSDALIIAGIWGGSLLATLLFTQLLCRWCNIALSNLFSFLILQTMNFVFFNNTNYYLLIAYCLLLGQGLNVSVSLYLDARKKVKLEAKGE